MSECKVKEAMKKCKCSNCKNRRSLEAQYILTKVNYELFHLIYGEIKGSQKKENKDG